jgi:Glycosyltransferases involved in cell wall biogenesis
MTASSTHLVLIPSYNPGAQVYATVRAARQYWNPVWVVIDGSSDGTPAGLQAMAADDSGLRVIHLPQIRARVPPCCMALSLPAAGYTHALTMDSDGQHPAERIPTFMAESARMPAATDPRCAGIRHQRTQPARERPPRVQLVGKSGNAMGRYR